MTKLEKLIKEIELPETLYENAEEKYQAIARRLEEKIGDVVIYPQGSFSIGTTIKPYKDGKDQTYDIDLILETSLPKEEFNGKELLNKVKEVLVGYDTEAFDKCITIHYSDVNGYLFNLDVVPAVTEIDEVKEELLRLGANPNYVQYAIAISSKNREDRDGWYTAIPKGYTEWLSGINNSLKEKEYEKRKRALNETERDESIEDIPRYRHKTPLQETVELLKRFRDVYYSKIGKHDKKPISAIITTIVAKIVSNNMDREYTTSELLQEVINSFKAYSEYNMLTEWEFRNKYSNLNDIRKENGNWIMLNPVNPKDNLLDQWNEDKEVSELFFQWISHLEIDYKKMVEKDDDVDYSNLFGTKVANSALGLKPVEIATIGAKPYGETTRD